ncbi:MAG: O-antigen ligase family protein [bacterium]
MGFTAHQNTLGALLLFTIPFVTEVLYEKLLVWKKIRFIFKSSLLLPLLFYFFLFTFSFLLLFLTHSRTSIISIIIFFIMIALFNLKKKYILILTGIISMSIISLIIIPQSRNYFVSYIMKDEVRLGDNRLYLYEASYKAALQGGVFGLGYGISSAGIQIPAAGSHFENGRYIREKGNSILAVIEETGIVGIFLFMVPILYAFHKLLKTLKNELILNRTNTNDLMTINDKLIYTNDLMTINNPMSKTNLNNYLFRSGIQNPASSNQQLNASILFSLLAVVTFHAQFEAWWVGVTSFQMFIFLILLQIFSIIKPQINTN